MSGSVLEALMDARVWSEVPPRSLGVVGRPSQMSEVVGRPSQMSGSDRDALPDVWQMSGGPPRCPGLVVRPSRMSASGWEALSDV